MKISTINTIVFLVISACCAVAYLAMSANSELTYSDKVNAIISIVATLGALVSAAIVIASYSQVNRAFIESKRPPNTRGRVLPFANDGNGQLSAFSRTDV